MPFSNFIRPPPQLEQRGRAPKAFPSAARAANCVLLPVQFMSFCFSNAFSLSLDNFFISSKTSAGGPAAAGSAFLARFAGLSAPAAAGRFIITPAGSALAFALPLPPPPPPEAASTTFCTLLSPSASKPLTSAGTTALKPFQNFPAMTAHAGWKNPKLLPQWSSSSVVHPSRSSPCSNFSLHFLHLALLDFARSASHQKVPPIPTMSAIPVMAKQPHG
mmetsp:Transcript_58776/g.108501  ORF Transcript_58776/g.108501 Transcript_58776/m.108501 type:complete len:218 (-) Transcript_58776:48-701(-)